MNRIIFIFSFLFLMTAQQVSAQLEQQANNKIAELKDLIGVAEQIGIDVRKEKMTVRLSEVFLDFADWDENHQAENVVYFDLVPIYKDTAETMAALLPDFERQEVILMLDAAIDYLQKLISGEYSRKTIPNIDWSQVEHDGDQLTFDDRPVFLEDYTWKPSTSRLTQYFGDLDGFYISPNHVTDNNGTINPNIINDLNSKSYGNMGFIFINNQNIPDWAKSKYGSEFEFRPDNNFTDYDIDHPGAKEMMGFLIDGTVGKMAGKKYTQLGYMLCNEPHFFTKQGVWATGSASDYTIDKFKIWLENKHTTIANLNTLWGSSFSDFDDVTITIPLAGNLQGTPIWYDWCRFNMHRVTEWYVWMKTKVRENDPNAKVMLKIMPRMWEENLKDHGIDLEALTAMSEIIGNDGIARTNNMWGPKAWWEDEYAFDWREMTMSYDFMKSVSPDKIVFNSEAHYLSSSRSRNLYEDPKYARATYWLAHTFGLNAVQTWFWPRLHDGAIKSNAGKGYAGSNCQQPRITYEVHATVMDLNAHSEEITAMQRQRKPLRIFYSKTSAINKPEHMEEDVFGLYKELIFDGVSIGFATKDIIEQQDNNTWDAILIYKTEYVTQAERDMLQTYLDNGGTIIMDNNSLTENEYGQPIAALSSSNGTLKIVNSLSEIKNEGFAIVENRGLSPDLIINETNVHNINTCQWKSVKNAAGNNVLSIINFGNADATIDIQLKNDPGNMVYKNLLNGVLIPNTVVLKPFEMLFVEVLDKATIVNDRVVNLIYPNPTRGFFKINFETMQSEVELQVLDMTGKLILQKTYNEVNQILESIEKQPAGNYIISLKIGEDQQSFIMAKI